MKNTTLLLLLFVSFLPKIKAQFKTEPLYFQLTNCAPTCETPMFGFSQAMGMQKSMTWNLRNAKGQKAILCKNAAMQNCISFNPLISNENGSFHIGNQMFENENYSIYWKKENQSIYVSNGFLAYKAFAFEMGNGKIDDKLFWCQNQDSVIVFYRSNFSETSPFYNINKVDTFYFNIKNEFSKTVNEPEFIAMQKNLLEKEITWMANSFTKENMLVIQGSTDNLAAFRVGNMVLKIYDDNNTEIFTLKFVVNAPSAFILSEIPNHKKMKYRVEWGDAFIEGNVIHYE